MRLQTTEITDVAWEGAYNTSINLQNKDLGSHLFPETVLKQLKGGIGQGTFSSPEDHKEGRSSYNPKLES